MTIKILFVSCLLLVSQVAIADHPFAQRWTKEIPFARSFAVDRKGDLFVLVGSEFRPWQVLLGTALYIQKYDRLGTPLKTVKLDAPHALRYRFIDPGSGGDEFTVLTDGSFLVFNSHFDEHGDFLSVVSEIPTTEISVVKSDLNGSLWVATKTALAAYSERDFSRFYFRSLGELQLDKYSRTPMLGVSKSFVALSGNDKVVIMHHDGKIVQEFLRSDEQYGSMTSLFSISSITFDECERMLIGGVWFFNSDFSINWRIRDNSVSYSTAFGANRTLYGRTSTTLKALEAPACVE